MARLRTREHCALNTNGFFTDVYSVPALSTFPARVQAELDRGCKESGGFDDDAFDAGVVKKRGRENLEKIRKMDKEAKEHGMSYGQYVGLQYAREHSPNISKLW